MDRKKLLYFVFVIILLFSGCSKTEKKSFDTVSDFQNTKRGYLSGAFFEEIIGPKVEGVEFLPHNNYADMIVALQTGKIDAISADRPTAELLAEENTDLYNIRESTGYITKIEDIADKRIGVVVGTNAVSYVETNFKDAKIEQFKSVVDVATAVKSKKIDCGIFDYSVMKPIIKQEETLSSLPDLLTKEEYAFAIRKGNTQLKEQIDTFIQQIQEDGTFDDIYKRWEEDQNYVMPKITSTGENGVIRVGISTDIPLPAVGMVEEQFGGYCVEMAYHFAKQFGYQLEVLDFEFGGLIAALESKKIDFVACDMTVTEERQKQVDFSIPYSGGGLAVLIQSKVDETASSESSFFAGIKDSFERTFLTENRWKLVLSGLGITIILSLFSMIFGTILGAGVCAMNRSKHKILSGLGKVYIRIIQGMPIVVMLMILYYIIFGSVDIHAIVVAIIGFSLNFSAYTSEMFRTGIDAVDKGQLEAAAATGFSKFQSFVLITLPQALKHILPVYKGEFISMVKMTSVVGYIAIQDLTKVSDIIRSRTYEAFFPLIATAIIYFLLTYFFILILNILEVKIDPKRRKRRLKGVVTND